MDEATKTTQENGVEQTAEKTDAAALPEVNGDNAAEAKASDTSPAEEKQPEAAASTAQEADKTEADKDEARERIAALEGKLAARDAGVPKEHTEDVLTLARAEMKKNGGTLEAAIEAVLKRHPSMKGAAPASITTGAKTKNDSPSEPDEAKVKEIMGLK